MGGISSPQKEKCGSMRGGKKGNPELWLGEGEKHWFSDKGLGTLEMMGD